MSNHATFRGFQYEPLKEPDEIRLIELLPSLQPTLKLHCQLVHTSFLKCEDEFFGNYTALSYVWGDPTLPAKIWIDDRLLGITANLFSALRDIRHESRTIRLWADGACINQQDGKEKVKQIKLMGKIFAEARQTIIYLGPSEVSVDETRFFSNTSYESEDSSIDRCRFVDLILSKEWFTRAWVFQELVFSKRPWLQYGKSRVKWNKFHSDVIEVQRQEERDKTRETLLPKKEKGNDSMTTNIIPRRNLYQNRNTFLEIHLARLKHHNPKQDNARNTLSNILRARRGLRVIDLRDMIYAHIGFALDVENSVSVDYSKSTAQVYEEFLDANSKGASFAEGYRSLTLDWRRIVLKESPVVAYVGQYLNTVVCVTSPLSTAQIPISVREELSVRLNDIKNRTEWDNGNLIIPSFDEESGKYTELVCDVFNSYNALEQTTNLPVPCPPLRKLAGLYGITIDDNPPNFTYEKFCQAPGRYSTVSATYIDVLCYVLRPGGDSSYVDGRALARLDNGELALVPSSTKPGDKISSTCRGVSYASGLNSDVNIMHSFVSRPIENVTEQALLDRHVIEELSEQLYKNVATSIKSLKDLRDKLTMCPVMHCSLIGECKRDDQFSGVDARDEFRDLDLLTVIIH